MKYPLTCLEGNNNLALVSAPLSAFVGPKELARGTGFFFRPAFERFFLITNRHVVIDEDEKFFPEHLTLKLHTDPIDLTKCEDLILPLYSDNDLHKPAWRQLDDSIDVVALDLNADQLKHFVIHAFGTNDLITSDIIVGVGDPLLVIGYPRGFSDEMHNLPIFRQASVASVYPVPFQGEQYFLIDSELHEGTSGSPVIT